MTEKQKQVLIQIGKVRILHFDDMNVSIERLEDGIKPVTKEVVQTYRFKGYSDTILKALKLVVSNELLVDVSDVNSALKYVESVERSNAKILKAIENMEVTM